jgi:AbrB family looped-hinge helix DNA binding protein
VKKATNITLINAKSKMENGQLPKSGITEGRPFASFNKLRFSIEESMLKPGGSGMNGPLISARVSGLFELICLKISSILLLSSDWMDVLETVKVSSRGQIVIPENVRSELRIKEGTKLILIKEGDKIIFEREEDFLRHLEEQEGWRSLSGSSLKRIWDNPKDDETWGKY